MISSRWHIFFLFLVLLTDRGRNGAFAAQPERPGPRSFARLERVYPFSVRYRALMQEEIKPAATSLGGAGDPESFAGTASDQCQQDAEPTFLTGSRLIYVLMSLQR